MIAMGLLNEFAAVKSGSTQPNLKKMTKFRDERRKQLRKRRRSEISIDLFNNLIKADFNVHLIVRSIGYPLGLTDRTTSKLIMRMAAYFLHQKLKVVTIQPV